MKITLHTIKVRDLVNGTNKSTEKNQENEELQLKLYRKYHDLIAKCEKLPPEQVQLLSQVADKLEKYDQVIDENVVSYDSGKYDIPDVLSPSIQRIISEFPINPNFQLDYIAIWDIENVRQKNYVIKELDELLETIENDTTNITAVSTATYQRRP